MIKRIIYLICLLPVLVMAQPYYISPTGDDDTGDGSRGNPWFSAGYAMNQCSPGDTVRALTGTYNYDSQQTVSVSGTAGNYITLISDANHPDSVVFDFWGIDVSGEAPQSIYGIFSINQDYLKFERFSLRRVWNINTDQGRAHGFYLQNASHIYFEWIQIDSIAGRGILGYDVGAANIKNIDVWWCADPQDDDPGNAGTGLLWYSSTANPNDTVRVTGSRFWQCADQGVGMLTGNVSIVDSVWSWNNDLHAEGYTFGTGNGFKPSLGTSPDIDTMEVIIKRSISAFNRAIGIHENTASGGFRNNLHVYNNTIYSNGSAGILSTSFSSGGDNTVRYHNNISFGNSSWDMQIQDTAIHSYNSWDEPYYIPTSSEYMNSPATVNADDFLALPADADDCTTILGAPRKAGGSLPDIGDYFKLSPDSDLIDIGTDVGLPFYGSAPDLGAFEYVPPAATGRGKFGRSGGKTLMYDGKRMIISQ